MVAIRALAVPSKGGAVRLLDRFARRASHYANQTVVKEASLLRPTLTLAPRRHARWRRLTISLLAVPAILIGLLAMHFLVGQALSEASAHSIDAAAARGYAATDLRNESPSPVGCDEMCGPAHDTVVMACVLALLVTAMLTLLHAFLTRWRAFSPTLRLLAARALAQARPLTPSLNVLSISRT